MNAAEEEKQQL